MKLSDRLMAWYKWHSVRWVLEVLKRHPDVQVEVSDTTCFVWCLGLIDVPAWQARILEKGGVSILPPRR